MCITGLDRIDSLWPKDLEGSNVGLVSHPASINRKYEHATNVLLKSRKLKLKVLFGPQHGLMGQTQDNMVEWKDFEDTRTGLHVYSLYGKTREPGPKMLEGLDVLVIDLQDIGSRYYTFIWTMELCMNACTKADISVVVLDRPNPIGGIKTEGPLLDPSFASFVGYRPLPVRHGMTVGEIGTYLWKEFYPALEYHVIQMKGWKRKMWYDGTKLPWVFPSPNMPSLESAIVYPGMCLLEGTNISEGRGTTRPFEIFGAPFIEPDRLVNRLNEFGLQGVVFRPMYFEPVFQKYTGKLCGGAQIHIINREKYRPFRSGVAVLKAIYDLYPEGFAWKQPPYEYETEKLPIDILCGTDRIRKDIERGEQLNRMEDWWKIECREFTGKKRKRYLMYE